MYMYMQSKCSEPELTERLQKVQHISLNVLTSQYDSIVYVGMTCHIVS